MVLWGSLIVCGNCTVKCCARSGVGEYPGEGVHDRQRKEISTMCQRYEHNGRYWPKPSLASTALQNRSPGMPLERPV